MTISPLLLFTSVYLAATAAPGLGIAALAARVLAQGLRGIGPFIAGYVVGDLIWCGIASSGIEVLGREFASIFAAIKYFGVAYLLYLAFAMWRAPAARGQAETVAAAGSGGWRLFLGTLTLTLGNPKGDRIFRLDHAARGFAQ